MNTVERPTRLVESFLASAGKRNAKMKAEARDLAVSVHRGGVDLCMDRATEFSPRIGELFTLAAQLALIAFGANSDKVDRYKKDLPNSDESTQAFEAVRSKIRS